MAVAEIIGAIAWPIVVGSSLFYFRKQVQSVLNALESRLKSGASMKFGSLEIGPIVPQSASDVKNNISEEVRLALEAKEVEDKEAARQEDGAEAIASEIPGKPEDFLKRRISLAERTALVAIRDFYNTPINEMIKIGDLAYDGFFARDGKGFIVEVKYHRVGTSAPILVKNISEFLLKSEFRLKQLGWKNYTYIVAIVLDGIDGDSSIIPHFEKRLRDALARRIGNVIDEIDIVVFDYDQIAAEAKE